MEDTDDIKTLMYTAFERAFQEQLMQLYKVYISNTAGSSSGQAERTREGVEKAIVAYRLAIDAVDSWGGETGG